MTFRFIYRFGPCLLCVLSACAASEPEPAPPPPVLGPIEAPSPAPPPVEPPEAEASSKRRFGTVELHAGFNPDPHVVRGTAKGEVRASSIRRKCKGWISEKPDYLFHSTTAFFRLYVMARSDADVALVMRDPGGKVICNDDRKGTHNPRVQADLPIGTTELWVGVKTRGAEAPYTLGFSEVSWKPNALPEP